MRKYLRAKSIRQAELAALQAVNVSSNAEISHTLSSSSSAREYTSIVQETGNTGSNHPLSPCQIQAKTATSLQDALMTRYVCKQTMKSIVSKIERKNFSCSLHSSSTCLNDGNTQVESSSTYPSTNPSFIATNTSSDSEDEKDMKAMDSSPTDLQASLDMLAVSEHDINIDTEVEDSITVDSQATIYGIERASIDVMEIASSSVDKEDITLDSSSNTDEKSTLEDTFQPTEVSRSCSTASFDEDIARNTIHHQEYSETDNNPLNPPVNSSNETPSHKRKHFDTSSQVNVESIVIDVENRDNINRNDRLSVHNVQNTTNTETITKTSTDTKVIMKPRKKPATSPRFFHFKFIDDSTGQQNHQSMIETTSKYEKQDVDDINVTKAVDNRSHLITHADISLIHENTTHPRILVHPSMSEMINLVDYYSQPKDSSDILNSLVSQNGSSYGDLNINQYQQMLTQLNPYALYPSQNINYSIHSTGFPTQLPTSIPTSSLDDVGMNNPAFIDNQTQQFLQFQLQQNHLIGSNPQVIVLYDV